MGLIRVILAVSVVLVHAEYPALVGGRLAVQLFYIISGFLMSYILVETRTYPSTRSFYSNRFLRLWPVYAVVAAATFVAYSVVDVVSATKFFDVYSRAPLSADLFLGLSNVTIFFQDWVMFSAVDHGALVPAIDFRDSDPMLYLGLLVPQAWTLGVELTFYLVAPFILRSRRLIWTCWAASLLLRALLIYAGFGNTDPWTYRFFPTELALFLSGSLAHQIGLPVYRRLAARFGLINLACVVAAILIVVVYPFFSGRQNLRMLMLFGAFIVLIPGCFLFQNANRWDKWVGELSYPLYVCHYLVLSLMSLAPMVFGERKSVWFAISGVVLSLGFAWLLARFVAKPVERIRGKIRKDPTPASAT